MPKAKNVTVIPPTLNLHTGTPKSANVKRRVAGYARVSTDSDEQFTSYTAQVDYYSSYIKRNPNWEFVDVYTDATDIIGLKKNPTNGRRFSPIFSFIEHFRHKLRKCYFKSKEEN